MTKGYRLGTKTARGLIRAINIQGKRVTVSAKTLSERPDLYFTNKKAQYRAANIGRIRETVATRTAKSLNKNMYNKYGQMYDITKASTEQKAKSMRDFIRHFESHTESDRQSLMNAFETRLEQVGQDLPGSSLERIMASLGIKTADYTDAFGEIDTTAMAMMAKKVMAMLTDEVWDLWYWSNRGNIEKVFKYEEKQ